jgi:CheY-like chemotaxis protein
MKKRIVIIEDDYIIQELHRHYVENLGHEVLATFVSGEEALEYFKDNDADLILSDVRLETSMDGIDTMREIQKIRTIPVVYITGNTEEENLKRALNTGMIGFLSKPIAFGELEDIIESINNLNDSILYAERIQKAIFTQRPEIHRMFDKSIYINRPKDIISGDFCFLVPKKKSSTVIGGLGDCTGHGIPAALLSVLCHEIVNSNSRKYNDLRLIITKLNSSIIKNLTKVGKKDRVNDGLDIVIFKVIPDESIIEIAGIKRPYIHYKAATKTHEYTPIKGKSIGEIYNSEDEIPFHRIPYEQEDYFYFFSDGITDQFGGINSKKLMKKNLIKFLDKLQTIPEAIRELELNLFLRKWQGSNVQTDDMLFIGICPSKVNKKLINYKLN